jgi:3'-phosphoadenosine 5'-phosphosulfate sulfotransferase
VARVLAIVEQICRTKIRIRVRMGGREKVVNVAPENVMSEAEPNE